MDTTWDAIVVGGGAAGLSAALMLGRARRRTVVVDAGSPRNRFAAHMHAVLGHDGLEPAELLARGRREVARYGVQVRPGVVDRVDTAARGVRVVLRDGTALSGRAVVVATGAGDELPDVPGLAEHWGATVLHCPYCHGWEVRGRRLGVLLTSPRNLHLAELVRQWSDRVTVFSGALEPLDPGVAHRLRSRGVALVRSPVAEVAGRDGGLAVRAADGTTTAVDALFTGGALRPHDDFLAHLGLARAGTPWGEFLAVDATGRTSNPRIWAAGNVATPAANVPMSVSAGAVAGSAVNAALVAEDFDDAVAAHAAAERTTAPDADPADFWERRYADGNGVWSGRPNPTLTAVLSDLDLDPGAAVDLGCGEGADAVWLARQGWTVTGVDISSTAVERARAAADREGVADRVRFHAEDLAVWAPPGSFDLVVASFLQSPVALPRTEVLRRAAAAVASGGHLLLVSHAGPPSWAPEHDLRGMVTPQEELAGLAPDPEQWEVRVAETRIRPVTAPDGSPATIDDGVVLLRRR